jgi:type IV secretory pathway TrbD component
VIYLVALVAPPLALLLTGRVLQAILSFFIYAAAWVAFFITIFLGGSLGFVLWLVAALHAVLVINNARKDARAAAVIEAMRRSARN